MYNYFLWVVFSGGESMFSFKKGLLTLFILSFIFLTACKTENNVNENQIDLTKRTKGDTFVNSTGSDAIILNPILHVDTASSTVTSYIFNSMVKFNPFYEPEPDLALSWENSFDKKVIYVHLCPNDEYSLNQLREDYLKNQNKFSNVKNLNEFKGINSEKNLILEVEYFEDVDTSEVNLWKSLNNNVEFADYRYNLIFNLRNDVKWSDGRPFTAADVAFTFEKIIDPESKAPGRPAAEVIHKVTVLDRFKVMVSFYKPVANALHKMSERILPKHILENQNIRETVFNSRPIGTGPYILSEWKKDEYILLSSNPDYYEGQPNIDKVMIRIIPDQSQSFIQLQNGQLDYMGLTSDQYNKHAQSSDFKERLNVFQVANTRSYRFIGYNHERELFKDKKFRHALSHALDVKLIIENIFYNQGQVVTGPFPIFSWAYNHDVKPFRFDVEKSRSILEELGWKLNGRFRENDGKRLSIELLVSTGSKDEEYVVNLIKNMWENVGIEVKLRFEEWNNYINLEDKGEFDAVVAGWRMGIDPDISGVWHSKYIPCEKNPSGNNFCRYSNENLDMLLEKGLYTLDPEKRKKIYHEIHEIIAEEQPYTFLYTRDSFLALDKRFHGVEIKGNSLFHDFENWWVPAHLVRYK